MTSTAPARLWRSRLASTEWAPLRVVYGGDADSHRTAQDGLPVDFIGWRSFAANP